jgi:hypothetical protein
MALVGFSTYAFFTRYAKSAVFIHIYVICMLHSAEVISELPGELPGAAKPDIDPERP